jgi:hypothetical protein
MSAERMLLPNQHNFLVLPAPMLSTKQTIRRNQATLKKNSGK